MHVRLSLIAAALITCTTPAWAATSNVDVYGLLGMSVDTAPQHGIVSGAADYSWIPPDADWQLNSINLTSESNKLASISSSTLSDDYEASARTTLGNNHTYAQIQDIALPMAGVANFSGWYDQITIQGGSGTGTANFTTQVEGTVDVGRFAGFVGIGLVASSVNPSSAPTLDFFPGAWDLDESAITPIYDYVLGISPFDDPAWLLANPRVPDLVLTPGKDQSLLTTLSSTLTFTYGEPFYLAGYLGSFLSDMVTCINDDINSCIPVETDGIGTSTLNFSNSVHLTNIALPTGATASFASGENYNVTTVPEPAEWLMLLAGLGLVGWKAQRRA